MEWMFLWVVRVSHQTLPWRLKQVEYLALPSHLNWASPQTQQTYPSFAFAIAALLLVTSWDLSSLLPELDNSCLHLWGYLSLRRNPKPYYQSGISTPSSLCSTLKAVFTFPDQVFLFHPIAAESKIWTVIPCESFALASFECEECHFHLLDPIL